MLTEVELFDRNNLLCLDNPANFQNTMNVTGACYVPSSWTTDLSNEWVLATHKPSYFSGYIFRGDVRNPLEILESGFSLSLDVPDRQNRYLYRLVSGASRGNTGRYGVSTSVCASACTRYAMNMFSVHNMSLRYFDGYIYLIDAVDFKGFAIPSLRPNDPIAIRFPHLREVHEVNFPNPIPNFKIVGVVYFPGVNSVTEPTMWPEYPPKLMLAVNPYYSASFVYEQEKTGMEAAKVVVDRFNDPRDYPHDWVMV
ncbi:hypothetical protein NX722_01475 [Endozoicomonas gorgoniicola]|uniref:Uncharacterized protein n=1 Tax=Endozoicomonas gorgoniicola TaxID=1234144 RepID=A0ABT3MPM6_9GAMM|nr:hypothetical protein [Endozoicomonas gorgoniicola]MCW7551331.1 hypothetical protein [Endozoicomonas gorgoniicola]